jgi:hypothetical protein
MMGAGEGRAITYGKGNIQAKKVQTTWNVFDRNKPTKRKSWNIFSHNG